MWGRLRCEIGAERNSKGGTNLRKPEAHRDLGPDMALTRLVRRRRDSASLSRSRESVGVKVRFMGRRHLQGLDANCDPEPGNKGRFFTAERKESATRISRMGGEDLSSCENQCHLRQNHHQRDSFHVPRSAIATWRRRFPGRRTISRTPARPTCCERGPLALRQSGAFAQNSTFRVHGWSAG
jgi:hypothetical protein